MHCDIKSEGLWESNHVCSRFENDSNYWWEYWYHGGPFIDCWFRLWRIHNSQPNKLDIAIDCGPSWKRWGQSSEIVSLDDDSGAKKSDVLKASLLLCSLLTLPLACESRFTGQYNSDWERYVAAVLRLASVNDYSTRRAVHKAIGQKVIHAHKGVLRCTWICMSRVIFQRLSSGKRW